MDAPLAWLELRSNIGQPVAALHEAIVLAQELRADILLVGDGKAHDLAIARGLRVMGTVNVLEQAAQAQRQTVDIVAFIAFITLICYDGASSRRRRPHENARTWSERTGDSHPT